MTAHKPRGHTLQLARFRSGVGKPSLPQGWGSTGAGCPERSGKLPPVRLWRLSQIKPPDTCCWQWPCFKEVWTRDLHRSLPKGFSVTLFTLVRLQHAVRVFKNFWIKVPGDFCLTQKPRSRWRLSAPVSQGSTVSMGRLLLHEGQ